MTAATDQPAYIAGQFLADQRSHARLTYKQLTAELSAELGRVRVILRDGDNYIRDEAGRNEIDWVGMCFTYERALQRFADIIGPLTETGLRELRWVLDEIDRADEELAEQEANGG